VLHALHPSLRAGELSAMTKPRRNEPQDASKLGLKLDTVTLASFRSLGFRSLVFGSSISLEKHLQSSLPATHTNCQCLYHNTCIIIPLQGKERYPQQRASHFVV